MAKKILLGLAVVGGGLYYYDQNVLPIFTTDKKGAPIALGNIKPSKEVREEYHKLGDKAKDFGGQLKQKAKESVAELKEKKDSAVSSIKDSETYDKWALQLEDYSKEVKVATDSLENKALGNKLAAKYIDAVNKLGETHEDRLKDLASSTSARQQEIKKDLAKSKNTWFSWFAGEKEDLKNDAKKKTDELSAKAEKEKKAWFNWGSAKADEAQQAAVDAKNDVKAEKDKWINWGSAKVDEAHKDAKEAYETGKVQASESFESAKQRALDEYYKAKKNVEELTKQAQEHAQKVKGRVEEDEHLNKAKKDFQSAFSNLKRFGSDLVEGK